MRILLGFFLACFALSARAGNWQMDSRKYKASLEFRTIVSPGNQKFSAKAGQRGDAFQWVLQEKNGKLQLVGKMKLADLNTGDEARDRYLREKVFDAARYPEAKVKTEPIPWTEDAQTNSPAIRNFDGTVTYHGATVPIHGVLTSENQFGVIYLKFDFTISLALFGLPPPAYGGSVVSNALSVLATFTRKY